MDLDFLQLNFRHRINALMYARWAVLPVSLAAAYMVVPAWQPLSSEVGMVALVTMLAFTLVMAWLLAFALRIVERSLRRQFIREARLPPFLAGKLRAAHPQLTAKDADLVLHGLRQFFMAHLRSGRKFVAMPSQVVDTAWHEFILQTQGYQAWCKAAFGGMLHHSPAEVLGRSAERNDGLRRTWYFACKDEGIDPRNPVRLPLLFALDAKFSIENGFNYIPDCRAIERHVGSGAQCGTGFSDSSSGSDSASGSPGDADSFGGCESSGSSSSDSSSSDSGDSGSSSSGCGGGSSD